LRVLRLMAATIRGLTAAARAAGFERGGWVPTGFIRWRMGQVHVGTSRLVVAREFWKRCEGAHYPRAIKRAVVRAALREHASNRRLYVAVMRGEL
jgi:hypothetical protein